MKDNFYKGIIACLAFLIIYQLATIRNSTKNEVVVEPKEIKTEENTDPGCNPEEMRMPSYYHNNKTGQGEAFNCKFYPMLKEYGLVGNKTLRRQQFKPEDVVFVTYVGSNHFAESRAGLVSLRAVAKKNKIIYYDVGLSHDQVQEVKQVCNLEYRKFDFAKYPQFITNLKTYSFKSAVIAEVFSQYSVFWFIDASARFPNRVKLEEFYERVNTGQYSDVIGRYNAGHGIFPVTHPDMLKYLPLNEEILRNRPMFGAWMLVLQSEYSKEVVKWNFLCAMTKECIAPNGSQVICKFRDRYKDPANCHRFDQSALNIIMANLEHRDGLEDLYANESNAYVTQFFETQNIKLDKNHLNLKCEN